MLSISMTVSPEGLKAKILKNIHEEKNEPENGNNCIKQTSVLRYISWQETPNVNITE